MIYKTVDMGMNSPWSCTVCETDLAKVAKEMKENIERIDNAETRVEAMETNQTKVEEKNKAEDTRMDLQEKMIKELQEQLAHSREAQGRKG